MITRPVVLWGPPASGKSTLGPMLARALSAEFVDIDAEVAREASCSVREIFARDGEASFRARERAVFSRALTRGACVIAAGGGALLETAFRREVLKRAFVIGLDASRDVLLERIASESTARPLLDGEPGLRLDALLTARRDAYAETHVRVDTNASPIDVLHHVRETRSAVYDATVLVMPLGTRTYRVSIGAGTRLAYEITALEPSRVLWVSDARVIKRVGGPARFGMSASTVRLTLRGRGEHDKTLASVRAIWDAALALGMDRDALVAGVGGGVVTDLVGFAASTLLRGIRYVTAPTTLLAMVDASVGGKTGFDHRTGKNLIGTFHQPSAVVCDPSVLATLSVRALREGLAEIAKIALACDASLLEALERDASALCNPTVASLAPHIAPAIQAKIDVVARDERESGERALLNFGHTFGHAIERAANYAVPHGECVALGIRAALRLGVREGITPADVAARGEALLDALSLPHALPPKLTRSAVIRALAHDKKQRAGTLRFVFCRAAGQAEVHPVSHAAVEDAVDHLLEIRPGRSRRVRSR